MTQRERPTAPLDRRESPHLPAGAGGRAGITRSSVAVHISNLMKKGYIVGKGYIVRTAPYAVVIGGVNMDIGGRSPPTNWWREDSNPGQVRISLGRRGRGTLPTT